MADSTHSGHRERLRSRYAEFGADTLQDHEFLELLLTYCIPRRDTNALAHDLIHRFGSLSGVLHADIAQLLMVDGVGKGAAVFLHMQQDLLRKIQLEQLTAGRGRVCLNTPMASAQYALYTLHGNAYETVLAVCLNSKREVLLKRVLQVGSLTEAQIYPRAVTELALLNRAHSVLLIHNHPSGSPVPSQADGDATGAVRQALMGIGVQLTDHLIAGADAVYSFAANRIIHLGGREPTTYTLEEWDAYLPPDAESLKQVMDSYANP